MTLTLILNLTLNLNPYPDPDQVKPQWGGGLAQKRTKDEQRDYEREVSSKPSQLVVSRKLVS